MGTVVKFIARAERAPRPARPAGECQIIILPCVRYERWDDAGTKPAPQKKKQRKRRARAR